MHISIIDKEIAGSLESQRVVQAARKRGHEGRIMNFRSVSHFHSLLPLLGKAVFWRTSNLNWMNERPAVLQHLGNKIFVQEAWRQHNALPSKLYQYEVLGTQARLPLIPTHHFTSRSELNQVIQDGSLTWPIVQKPAVGRQGNGVTKLQKLSDIVIAEENIRNFIYQPFIPNHGDYRVIFLGGKTLSVIHRTPRSGTWLNNLKQGGSAKEVLDPDLISRLDAFAQEVYRVFTLPFFGIDVIAQEPGDELFLLEINSVPGWVGFEKVTGINVADRIIEWIEVTYASKIE